ncbi:hypothetical protein LK994_08880 [Ferruginibacter lapsinanis]|uniref:MORN repeat-containing protein n=1 Tax=Ferruginibacter lapsinanis TaxID=563172 RepID=UPI001E38629C|nr:hypothetical protein [Ferruginibacter lapsinanis]UEG48750.1 hypothetical protein LK994_08880 [Ferruginibacter lapsinanis]
MKKFVLTAILLNFFTLLYSQLVTTGKIDSLKDAWDIKTTYIGEIKGGKPNGLGMAIYSNGTALRYVGYFVNGKFEGKGVLLLSNGSFSSGDWKNGKLTGQGTSFNSNKDLYVGSFLNGEENGQGISIFSDNSILQGNFKANTYHGRSTFINSAADVITDNMYKDGKKDGDGYQFELSNKKLFEGTWKNGNWVSSGTASFPSFLKDSRFFSEKTEKQVLMGITDKTTKLLEEMCFFYDLKTKKRYFGKYKKGYLIDGIIVRDDSTRLIGTYNDDGTYGLGHFLKIGKFYDEGNYEKDYLNDPKALSISLDKKTVYYGQVTGKAEFTGKAWFADNSNQLFNGEYLKGEFTGTGWRLDKTGYCVKGKWKNGSLTAVTSLYNNYGELINIAPKTFSDGLTTICRAYPDYFYGLQGNDDYSVFYDFVELGYESLIGLPGTTIGDVIISDYDYYNYYLATFAETKSFAEAKAKYDYLCSQVKTAAITLKKGGAPLKFSGTAKTADANNSFNISHFTLPSTAKGYDYFSVAVMIRKNSDNEYVVMLACGDKTGMDDWGPK